MTVNPVLFKLAQNSVWTSQGGRLKTAVVPPEGAAPPMAPPPGGAMPPTDPMAMGAPVDPAAMGMMPPATDPLTGAPGMDPAMAAVMGGGAMPPTDPAAAGGAPAPQKIKPEQWMQILDFRIYNLQQQMTAIMNTLEIKLPPDALVMPPGTGAAPAPEAALPGGPPAEGAMPPEAALAGLPPEAGMGTPPMPTEAAMPPAGAPPAKMAEAVGEPVSQTMTSNVAAPPDAAAVPATRSHIAAVAAAMRRATR